MNRTDLVLKVASSTGISKAQAATAITEVVDRISEALKKGERVTLQGFGTFSVSTRKARSGRNPQTGSSVKIAARKVARFTPAFSVGSPSQKANDDPFIGSLEELSKFY